MNRARAALLSIRALSDMLMVALAWIISYYMRFGDILPIATTHYPPLLLYFKLIPFICGIWWFVFAASGFYRRNHRTPFLEGLDILQSCILADLVFIAFTYIYEEYQYSRIMVAFFCVLNPPLIITGRSVIRKLVRFYRRKLPPRRTLIIGGGASLRHAIEMTKIGDLTTYAVSGVMCIGELSHEIEAYIKEQGLKLVDPPDNWTQYLTDNPTETVVFALEHRSYDFLEENLEVITNQVTNVRLIPDLLRYTRFAADVEVVSGTPVVNINESPLAGMGSILKRIMDIMGAMIGICFFGPLIIASAMIIKMTSRGPIFYKQERMGIDGRTFNIYKLRTMPVNAENQTGAVWAKKEDNRATPFGSLLRKTSIDEAPQFFNILRGDMSLVGPRPERPVFVEKFRNDVPGYFLRHKVKSGLTGWAQVNGWRGNTSIEKRIECDLFYIQNWSVWFDIRILFLTVFKGIINKNAY